MANIRPWDRQPGESPKAYHAFTHYRDLPPYQRSQARAYTAHRRTCAPRATDPETVLETRWEPTLLWKGWIRRFNWQGRAEAHDAEVAEARRVARVAEIAAMDDRHASIASDVQDKVIERLRSIAPGELTPGQLIVWLEKATAIERRARGQATDIVRHEGEVEDLSSLSEDEFEELERLVGKMQKKPGVVER